MPVDEAQYYASLNVIRILPIELPCKMDVFGIIRQKDHLLFPGADLLLKAVGAAAGELNWSYEQLKTVVFLRKEYVNKLLCSVTNRA